MSLISSATETIHLWSATFDKANKVKQWASGDDEDDRILSFSNVFFGDSTNEYELNVVNISESAKVTHRACSVLI